jgi:hypothetical protein
MAAVKALLPRSGQSLLLLSLLLGSSAAARQMEAE